MPDLLLGFIVLGILLILVVVAHIARRMMWTGRTAKDTGQSTIPELNEVVLRGEYFREQVRTLNDALDTVQRISDDLVEAANDWQERYTVFEGDVTLLYEREQELVRKVDALKNTPLPALDYFKTIMEREGKASAVRDYGLFFAGVVASIILTVILRQLGV
jgi:hypothetical protein